MLAYVSVLFGKNIVANIFLLTLSSNVVREVVDVQQAMTIARPEDLVTIRIRLSFVRCTVDSESNHHFVEETTIMPLFIVVLPRQRQKPRLLNLQPTCTADVQLQG